MVLLKGGNRSIELLGQLTLGVALLIQICRGARGERRHGGLGETRVQCQTLASPLHTEHTNTHT